MALQWSRIFLLIFVSIRCDGSVEAFRPRHALIVNTQLPREFLNLRCGSDDMTATPGYGDADNESSDGNSDYLSDTASDKSEETESANLDPVKMEQPAMEEEEGENEEFLVDDPTIDEDSSANVDRMEYADAYDDDDEEVEVVDFDGSSSYTTTTESEPITEEDSNHNESELNSNLSEPIVEGADESTTVDETEEDVFEDALPTIELQSQITQDMEEVMLKQLNYRASDLRFIRPEIASIIVAKKLERPMEGIPQHWYKSDSKSPTSVLVSNLKNGALIALTCAIAVLAGSKAEGAFSVVASIFQSSTTSSTKSSSTQLEADDPYSSVFSTMMTTSEAEVSEEKNEALSETDARMEHEHSVRPGEKYPVEPLDETWLDKGITAIERQIKKLFRL